MSGSVFLTLVASWLVVSLLIGYDARRNSQQDPFLWGATTFCFGLAGVFAGGIAIIDVTAFVFLGLAGVLLYLNLGRRSDAAGGWLVSEGSTPAERPRLRDCPHCSARELATAETCRFCGAALERASDDGPWFSDG